MNYCREGLKKGYKTAEFHAKERKHKLYSSKDMRYPDARILSSVTTLSLGLEIQRELSPTRLTSKTSNHLSNVLKKNEDSFIGFGREKCPKQQTK